MNLNHCKNCGYESHCDTPLYKALDPMDMETIIKVCDHCRCENCKDKQNENN